MRNDVDLAIYARKRWFNADEFTPSHVLYSDEYEEKWERFITGKDK